MMEAASTSETSVSFYQTTQHDIPEDILIIQVFTMAACSILRNLRITTALLFSWQKKKDHFECAR
jgi:hypothetical protein